MRQKIIDSLVLLLLFVALWMLLMWLHFEFPKSKAPEVVKLIGGWILGWWVYKLLLAKGNENEKHE